MKPTFTHDCVLVCRSIENRNKYIDYARKRTLSVAAEATQGTKLIVRVSGDSVLIVPARKSRCKSYISSKNFKLYCRNYKVNKALRML